MAEREPEIVVDDPQAPEEDSPAVARHSTVDIVVSVLLLALALLLAFDNRRTGMSWDSTGPQAGYFPFYLSVILAAAALFGLAKEFLKRKAPAKTFVTRAQLRRVVQVFVPTAVFCLVTQWLGIYVASFLLVAGFMVFVGRIAPWKALVTALVFSAVMFVTFDVVFDVLMPKGPLETLLGR